MRYKWILVSRDGGKTQKAERLSDHLQDQTVGNYHWRKEENSDCTINYVGYHSITGARIGFIPIDWDESEVEMDTFWDRAKARGCATLRDIMHEMMDNHTRAIGP